MAAGRLDKASALMPSKIEHALDQPKVFEVIKAIGECAVKNQIEFELVNLAALMSVGGNLNRAQVPFIAEQLIELYPNESIADFKLCFKRGAIGAYGDIQRLDGITIGGWMKGYLEEKYEVVENQLMNEKENYYKTLVSELSNVDWPKKWLDELASIDPQKGMRPITTEEIKREGKIDPERKLHLTDHEYLEENKRRIFQGQELTVRERHPEWSEEEIQSRLTELRSQTRYTTDAEKITGVKF